MIKSPFVKQVVYTADYGEVEKWIEEVYGHEFEIVAQDELSNDSTLSVEVQGSGLDRWSQAHMEAFATTGVAEMRTWAVLEDMCTKGLLEPGTYVIDVGW
jgi:hypothetical protein